MAFPERKTTLLDANPLILCQLGLTGVKFDKNFQCVFHSFSNASKRMSVQEWMEKTFHFTPRSFLVRVMPKNGMSGMPLAKMGLYLPWFTARPQYMR